MGIIDADSSKESAMTGEQEEEIPSLYQESLVQSEVRWERVGYARHEKSGQANTQSEQCQAC